MSIRVSRIKRQLPHQKRGNNGAKRKVYDNLEQIIEEVEPSHPEFVAARAKFISAVDVVRY